MTLPTFLCIGTFRSGTTWVHSALQDIPEIMVPYEKETMFFSRHYDNGPQWYAKFFSDAQPGQAVGEICPTYLAHPKAAERIHDLLPDARLFAVLRNPVEQIESQYKLHVLRQGERRPLLQAVRENPEYLRDVRYAEHLQRFVGLFGKENILVLLTDDLRNDQIAFLRRILEHIQVTPQDAPQLPERVNVSRAARFKSLDRIIAATGDFMRHHDLHPVKEAIKRTGIPDWLKRINTRRATSGATREERTALLEMLREGIDDLEGSLERSLEAWKTVD